ncbi:MAG: Hint domain-containing protein [Paracoccaceae bacterium]
MKTQNTAFPQGQMTYAHGGAPTGYDSGLFPGTLILTKRGEIPVEALKPTDMVITRTTGFVPVCDVIKKSSVVRRIRVAAGSLGHTRPETDLILPAGQPVLLRDWRAPALFGRAQAVTEIGTLVDGEFIVDLGEQEMTLFQIILRDRSVIYAGGLEVDVSNVDHNNIKYAA